MENKYRNRHNSLSMWRTNHRYNSLIPRVEIKSSPFGNASNTSTMICEMNGWIIISKEELGINRHTSFLWVCQKKALNYTFRKASRLVCFGTEVTGFLENRKIKQVTGVKSRELLMWFPLGEFFVDPNNPTKITFRTPAGLSWSYPTSAFELEEQRTLTLTT